MTVQFVWPLIFLITPLPLLFYGFLPRAKGSTPQTIRMPLYVNLQTQLSGSNNNTATPRWRIWLAIIIWLLLVTAAARPQTIGKQVALPVQGRNLMLAVDISGSMQEQDMRLGDRLVSRLTAVKAVAGNFIERRVGDRLGLILFGQQAYLQAPLSFDRDTVRTLLDEAAIGLAGNETAIGDAIAVAIKRLRKQAEGNRVLILLTDGTNTAGHISPLKAAELAKDEGIRIYTIGVGADRQASGFFGRSVNLGSSIDESTLQQVAKITGGDYYRARDLRALQAIYKKLDQLEPKAKDTTFYRDVHEWYAWPLGLALLLSMLSGIFITGLFRQSAATQAEVKGAKTSVGSNSKFATNAAAASAADIISAHKESYHVS